MKKLWIIALLIPVIFMFGCTASQTQVFQSQLFAWDDANVKTATDYANQIRKNWPFNYKVVEELLEGELSLPKYFELKSHMDKIMALVTKETLTLEEVAVVDVNFAKFLQKGGEKLIKEGLPHLLKFVSDFKVFFGI